jgi:hypothetical protein
MLLLKYCYSAVNTEGYVKLLFKKTINPEYNLIQCQNINQTEDQRSNHSNW